MNHCGLREDCDRMIALMTLMCHPSVPLVLQSYFDSGLGHVIC